MSALLVTFLAVWFNIDIGPMKYSKYTPPSFKPVSLNPQSMFYMLLPILLMIIFVFIYLNFSQHLLVHNCVLHSIILVSLHKSILDHLLFF